MKIAITGASGFVGTALCWELASRGLGIRAVVRGPYIGRARLPARAEISSLDRIDESTCWAAILEGVDCVIHCAARAHIVRETRADPLAAYRTVNVAGTANLAEQAGSLGVRRLVFVSSIGVLGTDTNSRGPFSLTDAVSPVGDYAVSKWEAERVLHAVAARNGLEIVTIRPPLVYGPGAKGNVARLLGLVRRGLPMPLAAVNNRRSLVGLDNLVDLLIRCSDHPRAAGLTFLVSDSEDLSTPELIRRMAALMGRPSRMFHVPVSVLRLAGSALGKRREIEQLVGSLQVDSSATREFFGWVPPVSVDEGLRRMVQAA